MTRFVKKTQGRNGNSYAILRDHKATFAVCYHDIYTWKYLRRHLTLAQAEDLLSLYAI